MHAPTELRQLIKLMYREAYATASEPRTAHQHDVRLGLEALASRICDQAGLKMPKEPKHDPALVRVLRGRKPRLAKRLPIERERAHPLTEYRWHLYGPRSRPRKPIEIDVAETTRECLPLRRVSTNGEPFLGKRGAQGLLPGYSLAPPLPRLLAFRGGVVLKQIEKDKKTGMWVSNAAVSPHPWHVPVDSRNVKDAEFIAWTHYDWRERGDKDEPNIFKQCCSFDDRIDLAAIAVDEAKEHAARARAGKLRIDRPAHEDEPEYAHERDPETGKKTKWRIKPGTKLDDRDEPAPGLEPEAELDFGSAEPKPGKLIMGRWRTPIIPESDLRPDERPPAWMREFWMPVWLTRSHLVTYCEPYALTRPRKLLPPKQRDVGFTFKHGTPVTTYVKYGRMQVGGATALERDDENAAELDWFGAQHVEAEDAVFMADGSVLESTDDLKPVARGFEFARDMGTRYPWQPSYSPDRLKKSKKIRAARWPAFAKRAFGLLGVSLSKRAPWIAQDMSRPTWYRNRDAFVERMRQLRRKGRSSRL